MIRKLKEIKKNLFLKKICQKIKRYFTEKNNFLFKKKTKKIYKENKQKYYRSFSCSF